MLLLTSIPADAPRSSLEEGTAGLEGRSVEMNAEEEVAMRRLRVLVVLALAGSVVWGTMPASADGGAFIEFNQTYYLPGDTAVATAYVLIPKNRRSILDRGPFFAFAVPNGSAIQEGHPIPDGAVRLGTFAIHARKHDTRLDLTFAMPELHGGNYTVQICNDPCTISGFREPLTGFFSIVHTARERRLLIEEQNLRGTIGSLKRKVHRADRVSEAAAQRLASMRRTRDELAAQLEQVRNELLSAQAVAARRGLLVDLLAVLGTCIALIVVAVAFVRKRRRAPAVVDLAPLPLEEGMEREPAGLP